MRAWIALLLLTVELVAAWKSPYARFNKHKKVQFQVKKDVDLPKNELGAMGKSLEPQADGPVLHLLEPDAKGGRGAALEKGTRIVNGKSTSRGAYPWQVGILIDDESYCGGALVSTTFVLTAAHCLEGAKTFAIVFGAQNRSSFEPGRLTVETSTVIMHPKWNKELVVNDIALLPLPYAVPLSTNIKTIRLPKKSTGQSKMDSSNVTICGWGKTSDDDPGPAANLNCARLKVISNTECSKLYGTDSFKSSNLCAHGYQEMSTCNGDSGGPLITMEKDKVWTLVGLVSYGAAASCQVGYPDVFTRVSSYLSWITNNTGIAIRP